MVEFWFTFLGKNLPGSSGASRTPLGGKCLPGTWRPCIAAGTSTRPPRCYLGAEPREPRAWILLVDRWPGCYLQAQFLNAAMKFQTFPVTMLCFFFDQHFSVKPKSTDSEKMSQNRFEPGRMVWCSTLVLFFLLFWLQMAIRQGNGDTSHMAVDWWKHLISSVWWPLQDTSRYPLQIQIPAEDWTFFRSAGRMLTRCCNIGLNPLVHAQTHLGYPMFLCYPYLLATGVIAPWLWDPGNIGKWSRSFPSRW